MAAVIAADVNRLGATTPTPRARDEWDREMDAFAVARSIGEKRSDVRSQSLGMAARLVEATASNPAYNMYDDETRVVTTCNPFHAAFKRIHGDVEPLDHYTRLLENMSGHRVAWDEEKRAFNLGPRLATLDHLEF